MKEAALLLLCIVFGLGIHLGLHLSDPPQPHRHEFSSDARGEAWHKELERSRWVDSEGAGVVAAVATAAPGVAPGVEAAAAGSFEDHADAVEVSRGGGGGGGGGARFVAEVERVAASGNASSLLSALRDDEGADALADALADADAGPMEVWASSGRHFPVIVLACDRVEMLRRALRSLLDAGARGEDVAVVQDGEEDAVAKVVAEFSGVHHVAKRRDRKKKFDGATRIAMNYGVALDYGMTYFADAPAIIVVEDDLLFSPDFLDYFSAVGPIVERDPSVFVVSAWNDNGFADVRDADAAALRRTEWFPGLGWLLPRKLWEQELKRKWPKTHWDHWMRDVKQHRHRESVYPEIPRSFHAGVQGTFMDAWHDSRYFATIKMQTDPGFVWPTDARDAAAEDAYERRISGQLSYAEHVNDLRQLKARAESGDPTRPLVLWYHWTSRSPYDAEPPPFVCVSEVLHIWHEAVRACHKGLHEAYLDARKVFLINAKETAPEYKRLKPADLAPLTQRNCPYVSWKDLGK